MPPAIDTDLLLRHADWVRRLSGELAADRHEAEDLAQETWLRALSRPPREAGGLRAWLAQVLGRLAANARLSGRRRARREEAAARPEAQPSAAEVSARIESQKRLAELVLELAPEQQEAVYLRYFEDLPPRSIAQRLGVPVETVRTRLKRARAHLRERLEREGGACALLLAPLAAPVKTASAAAILVGVLLMKKLTMLAAGLVTALAAFFVWRGFMAEEAPATTAPAQEPAGQLAAGAPPGDGDKPGDAASEATRAAAVPAAKEAVSQATIRGRLLRPGGAPLADAPLVLDAVGRVPLHLETRTAADGRFELRFAPILWDHYFLAARPIAVTCHWWSWNDLKPGDRRDLGDVELRRPATLVVRVVDKDGGALRHPWLVQVQWNDRDEGVHTWFYDRKNIHGPTVAMSSTGQAAADGIARLANLSPGRASIGARYGHAYAGLEKRELELAEGETREIELRYLGPAIDRVVALAIEQPRYETRGVDPQSITLQGGAFEPRHPDRALHFTDVPPGVYTLTAEDPRFEPFSRTDVRPGPEPVRVVLHGSAAIELVVLEKPGTPCRSFRVVLQNDDFPFEGGFPGMPGWPSVELAPLADRPDGRVMLEGVVPGNRTLTILTEGRSLRQKVEGLAPGERRRVEVAFGSRGALAGLVVAKDGRTPIQHAGVIVYRPAQVDDSPESPLAGASEIARLTPERRSRSRLEVGMAATDASGRFRIMDLDPGRYVVRAYFSMSGEALVSATVVAGAETPLTLTLPLGYWIEGKLLAPEGATFEKWRVYSGPRFERGWTSVAVQPDGTFRLGPLPGGPVRVHVHFGNHSNPQRLLEEVVLERETRVERTYDLRPLWPGTARIRVTRAGKPADQTTVYLHATGTEVYRGYNQEAAADGVARVEEVLAGRYRVTVTDRRRLWKHTSPAEIDVPPGGEGKLDLDVPLVEQALLLVDAASGEPLRNTRVVLFQADPLHEQGNDLKSDAGGKLRLALPVGAAFYVRTHADVWRCIYDEPRNMVSHQKIAEPLRGQPADLVWSAAPAGGLTVRVPRLP